MSEQMDNSWVTEIFTSCGSGFSLKVKAKLHEEQSPYQKLEIYDTETYGNLMVIDGCVMLTDRDNFLYHEMMSHPALFSHADPKHVVIIGGGDCGTLREVLKHPGVEKVTQIDIDKLVTDLSEKYFPQLCDSNNDPRAELLFEDGVKWVDNCPEESIDLIIVDSTDPVGPAEGLFKVDFFKRCFRILRQGGIMVQQSESPLYHTDSIIKDLHVDMQAAGFSTTATLPFPQPVYPSGWWCCTMAGKGTDVKSFRDADSAAKVFDTDYYTDAMHRGALTLPPFMKKILG
jgi:spermidine synthase